MTRETKVGLVLGTGIILLIGIVVSDHLSAQKAMQEKVPMPPGHGESASRQGGGGAPANAIDPAGPQTAGGGNAPVPPVNNIDQPRGPARGPAVLDNQAMLNNRTGPAVGAGGTGGAAGAADPRGSVTGNPQLDQHLAGGGFLPGAPSTPSGPSTSGAATASGTPTLHLGGPTGGVASGTPGTPGATATHGGASGAASGGATPPPGPAVADTRNWHTVGENESLWAIAQRHYGHGKYHEAISKANADKLLRDGNVREGVRLLIPPREQVVPGSTLVTGSPVSPAGGASTPLAGAAPRPMRAIRVEPGETLSAIARRELGSRTMVKLIIDANRDKIRNENDIKAGMMLTIPPLPAAGTGTPAAPVGRPVAPVAPAAPSAPAIGATIAKTYTVQSGESFISIARSRLGSDKRWKELYELNKKNIASPQSLREGAVLVMPADSRL